MRIGYNLFLWHILGRIKNCCFRRKMLSLLFFPSLGQISFLLCFIAPTLISSNLSAVYIRKESQDWLWWIWDPLVLMESSSSCCTIPLLVRHPEPSPMGVCRKEKPSTTACGSSDTAGLRFSCY